MLRGRGLVLGDLRGLTEFLVAKIKFSITAIFWAALIITPYLSLVIKSILFNIDAFSIAPYLSDELVYWRELYSFSEVGFDFGYSSTFLGDFPDIFHLGNHGLSPFLAFGFYALIFEWGDNAIIIFSMVSLIISLVIFVATTRPRIWQSILMIILILTSSYINIYNSSSMMEIAVLASIILAVALIINYQKRGGRIPLLLAIAAIIYCGLLRINYILLFIPLICLVYRKINLKLIIAMGLSSVGAGVLYFASSKLTAPYTHSAGFLNRLFNAENLTDAISLIFQNIKANISLLFNNSYTHPIETSNRIFIAILIIILLFVSFVKFEGSRKGKNLKLCRRFDIAYFGFFAVIASTMLLQFAVYDISAWKDFRVSAPIVFGTIVYLIARPMSDSYIKRLILPIVMGAAVISSSVFYMNLDSIPIGVTGRYKISENESEIAQIDMPADDSYLSKTLAVIGNNPFDGDIFKWLPAEYGIVYQIEPDELKRPIDFEVSYIVVANEYIDKYPYILEGYIYQFDINESYKLYSISK